jgi:hypothetical protein
MFAQPFILFGTSHAFQRDMTEAPPCIVTQLQAAGQGYG